MTRASSYFFAASLLFLCVFPPGCTGRIEFAGPVTYQVGKGSGPISAADFDTDGDVDLAIGNYNHGTVTVLVNQGNASFLAGCQAVVEVGVSAIAATDFTGDGIPDIAVVSDGVFDRTVTVLANQGEGNLEVHSAVVAYGATDDYYLHPRSIVAADLDGDGDSDIAVANETTQFSSSFVSVLTNDGNGRMGQAREYLAHNVAPREPESLAAADIDCDGDVDLLTINNMDKLVVLHNRGDGTFQFPKQVTAGSNPSIPLTSVVIADLNQDGFPDVTTTDGDGWSLYSLVNDGSGNLSAPKPFFALARIGTLITGDFDGDGDADLASPSIFMFPQSPTFILVLENDGSGVFERQEDLVTGYGDSHPEYGLAEDLDGDGDIDLAVVDAYNGSLLVFHNQLVPTPSSADLNEDRSIDFLDLLEIGGEWYQATGPAR